MGCSEHELVAQICDGTLNAEHAQPSPGLWSLSFIDITIELGEADHYPGGPAWLGGCIVEAIGPWHAARRAWELGCNPGGQAGAQGPMRPGDVAPEWLDRLLTADDIAKIPPPPRNRAERRRHHPRT